MRSTRRFFYVLKYTIKANPSPNGNGFAFNLFGDPYGNTSAAKPPRAPPSASGEPMGLLPRMGIKTKIEQA